MANYGVQGFINDGRFRSVDEYMEYMQAAPEPFELNGLASDSRYYPGTTTGYGGYTDSLSSLIPNGRSSEPTSSGSDTPYAGAFGHLTPQELPTIEIGLSDTVNIEGDLLSMLNSEMYSGIPNGQAGNPSSNSDALSKMYSVPGRANDKENIARFIGNGATYYSAGSANKGPIVPNLDAAALMVDPALGQRGNKLYDSFSFQIKSDTGYLQVPYDRNYQAPAMVPGMGQGLSMQLPNSDTRAQMPPPNQAGRFAILVATDNVAQRLKSTLMVPKVGDEFSMMESHYLDGGNQKMQRVYRPPGARRNLSTSSSRASERAGGIVRPTIQTDEQLLQACIAQVCLSVSPQNGAEHRSILDATVYMGNLSTKRSGIQSQVVPPSATVRPELAMYLEQWTSTRPRTDLAFRLTDDSGESFNLEELQVAVSILTSRPPRRINFYPAPQLTAEEKTQGNSEGSLLVMWDQHPHGMRAPSEEMRRSYNHVPSAEEEVDDLLVEGDDANPAGIIYKPRYVKGKGGSKFGWCNNCPEGGFFRMKNSGYLYHKNHEHGIFANGHVFEDPLCIRRKLERDTKWEGLCGICYRWMDIDNNEPDKWGTWFRHYNNCTKEYDELKKAILRTGAPVQFVEIEYQPYMCP